MSRTLKKRSLKAYCKSLIYLIASKLNIDLANRHIRNNESPNAGQPICQNSINPSSLINFMHHGHLGDIVYSLQALSSIFNTTNIKINLYLERGIPNVLGYENHPSGGRTMLSEASYLYVQPLLLKQSYINEVHFQDTKFIPEECTNLAAFRSQYINQSGGVLPSWYAKYFGIAVNHASKWLDAPSLNLQFKDSLVVSFSRRYRNTSINYNFLRNFDNVYFIGLQAEYESFVKENSLINVSYIPTSNALEAAEIINSSKCFIGNQSFFFSIAEGLKKTRALEVFEPIPNVLPVGENSFEYLFTSHLVNFLNKIFQKAYINTEDRYPQYRLHLK
jgi:hypothetical protein